MALYVEMEVSKLIYAYIRVSTKQQKIDRQYEEIKALDIDDKNIYIDKESGKDFDRTNYQRLIKKIKKDDLLIVKSIDRLGRNYKMILDEWSYITKTKAGKDKVLSLDGRLEIKDIRNIEVKKRAQDWIAGYANIIGIDHTDLKGAVFEVRQGYKSKDSKRQNGDIDNATVAYAYNYLPVFTIFSGQIDNDIVLRYTNNRCAIIIGTRDPSPYVSLYAFCKNVLGYDLANFFQRNSPLLRKEMGMILEKLFKL